MFRRLVTTVVVVLALLIAAPGSGWSGQVQHPVNGPPTSAKGYYPCWGNTTGNQEDNCPNGAYGLETFRGETAYALQPSDCATVVHFVSPFPVTVTLPNNIGAGCNIDVIQDSTGVVSFSPVSGAQLLNGHGFTKTNGHDTGVSLHVKSNSNGVSAQYQMFGDGAP